MRIPHNTYRLQISAAFDLPTAAATLPYLHDLGVDWVYLSPLLTAGPDSTHGYDVADHASIDKARGGADGLNQLTTAARRLGMGILVDIVPNHVGVAVPSENAWWWDVLTHGHGSEFAGAFDIDWEAGGGRLGLPVVGDEDLLPEGRIAGLTVDGDRLGYRGAWFPLAPGTADAADDPDAVHSRQHYRLVGWRTADHDLTYRRFFGINGLAGIRVEDPTWLRHSHAEITRWFDQGLVDGLRIDHIDGLREPQGYLDALSELTGGAYLVVEKILALRETPAGVELEREPPSWPIAGTTGYDVLGLIDRVLVDPAGEGPLTELEDRLRGHHTDWPALVLGTKREVGRTMLNSEIRRIAREVRAALPAADAPTPERGTGPGPFEEAVAEVAAQLPVYRTYLPFGAEHLQGALAAARAARPELAADLDRIGPVLLDPGTDAALRFQQTSGMVMAKGVEDNAFYRWARLTSLNEVGGDPNVFSLGVERFHVLMAQRQAELPHAQTATATHDTKRSEDTRARIAVLSELPEVWADAMDELQRLHPMPEAGSASLVAQAVMGTWPVAADRVRAYAEKALREGGELSTWVDHDEANEARYTEYAEALASEPHHAHVLRQVAAQLCGPGHSNSLAAKLLALTLPGVPDVYQGTELWDHSLVDPDNRRSVDYLPRAELLARIRQGWRPTLTDDLDDAGAVKLLVTHLGLTLRRDHPELFTGYTPLSAAGPAADHVVAFDRGGAVTVVTRLPIGLERAGGWGDTTLTLPSGPWHDLISDRPVTMQDGSAAALAPLLDAYPVALLVRREPQG